MSRMQALALAGLIACGRPPAVAPPADRLMAAVRADSLAAVLSLLDQGANPNAPSTDGSLPLGEAIGVADDTIAVELLRAGADPAATDTSGLTAYDHAMEPGDPSGMDLLILHAARAAGGGPAVMEWFATVPLRNAPSPPWQGLLSGELLSLGLMYAALHDRTDLIGALRRARELPNRTGYHALAVASRWGLESAVWALLGVDTHADLPMRTSRRSTALMEAARDGLVSVGRELLAAGARVDRPDARGETALHWAARHGRREYAELLLAAGAGRGIRNAEGRTPLAVAVLAGHADLAELLDPDRSQ